MTRINTEQPHVQVDSDAMTLGREQVVEALVIALASGGCEDFGADWVEDFAMPGIDDMVRKHFGHEAWLAWVR